MFLFNLNSSLEWINKPYTKIYFSNTINADGTKITMDLLQYNEFMLTIELNNIICVSTVISKAFIGIICRAMIDETALSQMRLDTDGFMVWRLMPNNKYYLSVYAR